MGLRFLIVVAVAVLFGLFYNPDTFDPKSIHGKRVLITGSSSGIGEELAYQYSKLGAQVIITARREELLRKVASKCKELGAKKVEYVVADMARIEDRKKLVCATEKHLGGLDHLILNHGVENIREWFGDSEDMRAVRQILDTNLIPYMDMASRCLPMLTESKGNIGVVTSLGGKIGMAYLSTHSMWKGALHGFFSAFRQELRLKETGVSVTLGVLGYIATASSIDVVQNKFDHSTFFQAGVVNETATVFMKGVVKRSYEVHYPNDVFCYVFVSRFFPNYVEDYIGLGIHGLKK